MKVILVSGGSGGHIYPCLELGKYLEERGYNILFCGGKNTLEEKIMLENKLQYKGIFINRKNPFSYIKNFFESKKIIKQFAPDLIILFGNYISVSFALGAFFLHVPIYLHEQNVVYGRANKFLGYIAKRIYLSLPLLDDVHENKSYLVGNPKSDIKDTTCIKFPRKYNIVIVMGSLGSTTINKLLKEFVSQCNDEIDFHLVVGNKYYEKFIANTSFKQNIHVYPYLKNLLAYLKSCDVFVSRAGATTISEILVNGIPSVLIPSPYVKDNHQYKNAKYLADNGACVLIEEKDLTASKLHDTISQLINNYTKIIDLKFNAKKLAVLNAKTKIYEDLEKTYER